MMCYGEPLKRIDGVVRDKSRLRRFVVCGMWVTLQKPAVQLSASELYLKRGLVSGVRPSVTIPQ
ncbi:MAG: hypothetical protein ACKO3H_03035 [Verrucomicrobiota bacterium]